MKLLYRFALLVISILLFIPTYLSAQNYSGGGGGNPSSQGAAPAIGKIKGIVRDSISQSPIEFATISLYRTDKLVGGCLSDISGNFVLPELQPGNYRLKIDFIGYRAKEVPVELSFKEGTEKYIGEIALGSTSILLNEAEIVANKSVMASNIDKKVFLADQLMTSQAGTASDVLSNVPSVTTDADGKASLRGSENVTILIDGRPSGLAGTNLSQLPANIIHSIEVITNPSAKYDPDGTSGIINIILKKNARQGFSGQTTIGAGAGLINDAKLANGNVQLNYQTEKFNISSNATLRYDDRPSYSSSYREVTLPDNPNGIPTAYYRQKGEFNDKNLTGNVRLGLDYTPNEKNTFSVAATYGATQRENITHLEYLTLNTDQSLSALSIRTGEEDKPNQTLDLNANFRHEFGKPKHFISLDVFNSASSNDGSANYKQQVYNTDYTPQNILPTLQHDIPLSSQNTTTAQLDFSYPMGKGSLLELGAKTQIRTNDNDYRLQLFDYTTNSYVDNLLRSNHFVYDENIYALYATVATKLEKFGYKLGLRAEQVVAHGDLLTTNEAFDNDYFSLFPTANLSYELNSKQQIQLSYSRRINRPQPQNLNPFADISDPLNIRMGNPYLQPEYVNSFDLGYAQQFADNKYSITTSLYYRRTDNSFVRTLSVSNGINPATGDSTALLLVQMNNAGYSDNYGLEFALNATPSNALSFNFSTNVFRNDLNTEGLEVGQSSSLIMATFKLIASYKLPAGFDVQLSGFANTPRNTPQGRVKTMGSGEVSIRKKIMKGKGTLNLTINDIFNTQRFAVRAEDTELTQEFWRKRETRLANLSFTYRFGKNEQKKKRTDRPEIQRSNDMPDSGGF
jgi:outer membrane receptor protein involved in Fe transport